MVASLDRRICFRLADTTPAVPPAGPVQLEDGAAEALSELLQVFSCGEESAYLAFGRLGGSSLEDAARRGLARIAGEELIHERLLRGLRCALPAPARDRELRHVLLRFYHDIAHVEIGLHLASIASLDSAVCLILSALLEQHGVLAQEPSVASIFRRIHRDEAGHVRVSRRVAAELARRDVIGGVAESTRRGLVDILARRGAAFERLGVQTRADGKELCDDPKQPPSESASRGARPTVLWNGNLPPQFGQSPQTPRRRKNRRSEIQEFTRLSASTALDQSRTA
jgi:hypothetical protein